MQGPLDGCNSWSWWWSLGFVLVVYRGCQVNSSISRLVRLPMARIGCNLGIWATHHFETLREETQHFFWHYRKELLQMELFVLTSVVFFVRKGFCVEFWLVIVFYKNMLFPNFHPRPLCSRSPPQKKTRRRSDANSWKNDANEILQSSRCDWISSCFLIQVDVFGESRMCDGVWFRMFWWWMFLFLKVSEGDTWFNTFGFSCLICRLKRIWVDGIMASRMTVISHCRE